MIDSSPSKPHTQRILGIDFFDGTVAEAVERALQNSGVLVAPSGTCFARFCEVPAYRAAILHATIVLPDSGSMVLLWRLIQHKRMQRISGLRYLMTLLEQLKPRDAATTFWVLPGKAALTKLQEWAVASGFPFDPARDAYVAPIYENNFIDTALAEALAARKPRHIIIGLAGGAQELLAAALLPRLSWPVTIHCVGGAVGLVCGEQARIPSWADRIFVGWIFRMMASPRKFLPRLWQARILPGLLLTYGTELPPVNER